MYRYNYRYNSALATLSSTTAIIIYVALIVFMLAALWKLFVKGNQPGWKCLIPIYNSYIYWDIGWDGSKFLILFFGGIGLSILSAILGLLGRFGQILTLVIAVAWGIYALYLTIKQAIMMAHRFGKSTAFGVILLFFLPIIGIPILGFGSADYDGQRDW